MTERYDLHIGGVVTVGEPPGPGDETRTGWIELGEDLETVRACLRRALQLGRAGYVVPARYRIPAVRPEDARQTAEEVWERESARGRRLGPLAKVEDGLLWWEFVATDHDLQERGVSPGTLQIAVDKLDGSIRTDREYDSWLRLSFPDMDATYLEETDLDEDS